MQEQQLFTKLKDHIASNFGQAQVVLRSRQLALQSEWQNEPL